MGGERRRSSRVSAFDRFVVRWWCTNIRTPTRIRHGSEKVWAVLNRIDTKGSPLPGYKGGSVYKNERGLLPETSGVTYREWDVNPKIPGQSRDLERIITGSDGSAYYTFDHYATSCRFEVEASGSVGRAAYC